MSDGGSHYNAGPDCQCPECEWVFAGFSGSPSVAIEDIESPGYHLKKIPKGVLGEPSKILEEFYEFIDAEAQGVKVMQLVELSDMIGAIEALLERRFPGVTVGDLVAMAAVTRRAFENGRR